MTNASGSLETTASNRRHRHEGATMTTASRSGGRALGAAMLASATALLPACNDDGLGAALTDLDSATATPIKHVVVVFQENVPFDRYFGVYPDALNPPGEPRFVARPGTPTVNGLTEALLSHNPNAANPRRLDREQPGECGSNHDYTAEQLAEHMGLVDQFVEQTGNHERGCDP